MAKRFGRTKVLNVKAKAKAKSLKDFTQLVKFNKDLAVETLRTLKTLHSELRTLKPGRCRMLQPSAEGDVLITNLLEVNK